MSNRLLSPKTLKDNKLLPSVLLLIATNIIPIFGALFWDWNVFEVVLSYCLETFVIGIIHAFKMLLSKGGFLKFFMIPFFLFHYNMFVVVQTIFVIIFMSEGPGNIYFGEAPEAQGEANVEHLKGFITNMQESSWWWFPIVLALSHLFSYFFNYIGKGEFENKVVANMMIEPYGRIMVQQFTVIGGAFLIGMFNSPLGMLLILIVLKTGLDVRSHVKEHTNKKPPNSFESD